MTNRTVTTIPDQGHPGKKVVTDLPVPRLLAKRPVIGLVIFIFGCLMFGGLLYNLRAQGPLLLWDKTLANTLPAIGLQSPPYVRVIMDAGFYIGDQILVAVGVLLGIYFFYKRFWRELALVAIGLVGASTLFLFLSNLIGRVRPLTQIWIIVKLPGFPSGHAITVVAFYGLLVYLLVPKMRSVFGKVVVAAAAFLIIVFVGFSRIFTGGHYLTDILAGYAVGLAWSGAAYTLIDLYFQKRRSQNVKKA